MSVEHFVEVVELARRAAASTTRHRALSDMASYDPDVNYEDGQRRIATSATTMLMLRLATMS